MRRGHVTIAGGGEIIGTFLPSLIASYRRSHDGVSFEILRRAADECLSALQDFLLVILGLSLALLRQVIIKFWRLSS